MATLSLFLGIIITMYNEAGAQHHSPHFHAEYGEYTASFDLDGSLLAGGLPRKQTRLVEAWLELHREELSANWTLLSQGREYFKIDPLR